jgi:hypothetical protein
MTKEYKEIIHDGNIYYDIPLLAVSLANGITMLTIDEMDDKCCSDCTDNIEEFRKLYLHAKDRV